MRFYFLLALGCLEGSALLTSNARASLVLALGFSAMLNFCFCSYCFDRPRLRPMAYFFGTACLVLISLLITKLFNL